MHSEILLGSDYLLLPTTCWLLVERYINQLSDIRSDARAKDTVCLLTVTHKRATYGQIYILNNL